jgi:hypothetical protein
MIWGACCAVTSFMPGSLAGVGFRAVLQVDEGHDHPGPGSVGGGIGEAGGELLDMAAQLGQRRIGEPEGAEALGSTWSYLDITALGRQEEWEDSPEGSPQTSPYAWWNYHDAYGKTPNRGPLVTA